MGCRELQSRDGWTRVGRDGTGLMCELLEGLWEGWGGGRAGSFGEALLFFVLMTANKQKILIAVDFSLLVISLFLWEKGKGKRRNGRRERK